MTNLERLAREMAERRGTNWDTGAVAGGKTLSRAELEAERNICLDCSRFWDHQDLVYELTKRGDPLSMRAVEAIGWLRENMINPVEYMRVSNERSRLMAEIIDRGV